MRNSKNSFKLKFKRWGTLAPQEHLRSEDFYMYHDTPVKMGIFAFPERLASRECISGACISNGRLYYLRDENGNKVKMTYEEYCALETKEKYGRHLVVSPKFLRGVEHIKICLDDEGITTWTDRLRTFSYGGNIWHHLEFTNNYIHWLMTDDGIKESKYCAYYEKECFEDFDLEGQLKSIISGDYAKQRSYYEGYHLKSKCLVKQEDIIRRSGSWILTSMRTYKKALEKTEHVGRYEAFMRIKAKGEVEGFPMGIPKRKMPLELFEVFIEKV